MGSEKVFDRDADMLLHECRCWRVDTGIAAGRTQLEAVASFYRPGGTKGYVDVNFVGDVCAKYPPLREDYAHVVANKYDFEGYDGPRGAVHSAPDLFMYDYARMRSAMSPFRSELLAHVMHPDRIGALPGLQLV